MCQTPQAIFAWVGAVLVNFGFVSLITWSSQTLWPLGFGLCAAYTALLFGLAAWLQTREERLEASPVMVEQHDHGAAADDGAESPPPSSRLVVDDITRSGGDPTPGGRAISLPVSLLYGLAVVSMGVCGLFIPINVFQECDPYGRPPAAYSTWTTNISALPDGVQGWAKKDVSDSSSWRTASFAYLVDTKTTFFSAQNMSGSMDTFGLWSVNNMTAPEQHQGYMYPGDFIAVSNQTVCFTSISVPPKVNDINCGDETGIHSAMPLPEGAPITSSFFALNGTLWFKAIPTELNQRGTLVYSLDPGTMNATLYSAKESTGGKDCDDLKQLRNQAIATFFVTALPVTLASISIWRSRRIPSMAATTFVGLIAMCMSVYVAARPNVDIGKLFQWFCSVTGFLWLLLLTYFNLLPSTTTTRQNARVPLQWGLVIGGLAVMNTWAVLPMDRDRFIDWILLNTLLVLPLLLLGAANSNGFLQFLGAVGFLADAGRLAGLAGDQVGGQAEKPIQFLVFSVTGILVGLGGFEVNQYQDSFRQFASTVVRRVNEAMVRPVNPYVDHSETEQEPVPLLDPGREIA